jgi:hypothetical protein
MEVMTKLATDPTILIQNNRDFSIPPFKTLFIAP